MLYVKLMSLQEQCIDLLDQLDILIQDSLLSVTVFLGVLVQLVLECFDAILQLSSFIRVLVEWVCLAAGELLFFKDPCSV